jgi:NADH dehydrogenase [ubiquinone] 1 alpha subcomplex assembly factor 6
MKCAELVGRCLGILDYVKRVPFTLRRYRLYMPDDVMRKYNVSVRNLWDRIEGKPKDDLFDVILEVAAFAKKCLDEAKPY